MTVDIAGHNRIHSNYVVEQPPGKSVRGINTEVVDRCNTAISAPVTVLLLHPLQYSPMLFTVFSSSRKPVLLHGLFFQFKMVNRVRQQSLHQLLYCVAVELAGVDFHFRLYFVTKLIDRLRFRGAVKPQGQGAIQEAL